MTSTTKTVLTQADIQRLAQHHFGDVTVESVRELTEGCFNAIYVVTFAGEGARGHKELVLKTGVQEGKYILTYEKDTMKCEIFVYGLLREKGIPTPEILATDFSHELIDCDYFFMEMLQGDNWGKLNDQISAENREKLIKELAKNSAMMHQIKGPYFGYIKDDQFYQHDNWKDAFKGMVQMNIDDGRAKGVELPYDEILTAFEPLWDLMDDVTEPVLINFDMWTKNIMLREENGEYVIDGFIDHERNFYGDEMAEMISAQMTCGPLENCPTYVEEYSRVSGRPLVIGPREKVRISMYMVYLMLLGGVEIYRFDESEHAQRTAQNAGAIRMMLGMLTNAVKEL